jgi:hypothetical protein
VLLISGGSYVSQAQQQSKVAVTATSAVKAFENKIAAYEKETNATKSAALLEDLKKEVGNGMAAAKSAYSNASAQGKADATSSLMRQYEVRTKAYNDLMMATRGTTNKASVVQALKSYAQTL